MCCDCGFESEKVMKVLTNGHLLEIAVMAGKVIGELNRGELISSASLNA